MKKSQQVTMYIQNRGESSQIFKEYLKATGLVDINSPIVTSYQKIGQCKLEKFGF